MESSISGANHAVLHAQIKRRSLGLIETCNSDPKVAVLHAKKQIMAGSHRDLQFWC